ncbi:Cytochrome c oxidase subunit 6A [Malassezia sp. CBS 17886]|nr:Cytochrome c oxidase subunit 6A [Malassezia sp. CBS 17886]
MSMIRAMLPRAARAARVQPQRAQRGYATFQDWKPNPELAEAFVSEREHAVEHAATAVFGVYMYRVESAHIAHGEEEFKENGDELPPRPDYPYLNLKAKNYPWGQQTLFFNPRVNYPAVEM